MSLGIEDTFKLTEDEEGIVCEDLMNVKNFRSLSRYCDPGRVKQISGYCS